MKKIPIEHYLAKLDSFLSLKKAKDKNILMALPFLVFGFLSYQYVIPSASAKNKKIASELRSIKSEMNTYEELVSEKLSKEKKIQELQALKNHIEEVKELSAYIDAKLESVNFVYFNPSNRSNYLHRLVLSAKKNKISMSSFSNSKVPPKKENTELIPVLTVDFNAVGTFENIFAFIKDIESDVSISNIEKISLRTENNKIIVDFTIIAWGV
ncbi:MAG: hypothetical protein QG567_2033 [Campylobacterota bacterium]|nr:hypothetical protein [Campylobacterota bacterium]